MKDETKASKNKIDQIFKEDEDKRLKCFSKKDGKKISDHVRKAFVEKNKGN